MRLEGRVAIVTGAAQGIGAAYAAALVAAGAAVSIWDIEDPANGVAAATAAGGKARGSRVDILDEVAVAAAVEETLATFGKLDILVNNAALFGKLRNRSFSEIPAEEWDRVMAVNVRGTAECVKAVLPHMRSRKYGKIINVGSCTVYRGTPNLMHYVASKGAVVAMTRAMARELGDDGVRVNCLSPGFTASDNVVSNADYTSGYTQGAVNARALKREQHPDDLVGTLIYLASADSDFVTGQTIVVDGGAVML